MKIEVTVRDIKTGKNTSFSCPVARAIQRAVGIRMLYVTEYRAHAPFRTEHFGRFPKTVTTFINRFDERLPVKPFTFELEVIDEVAGVKA